MTEQSVLYLPIPGSYSTVFNTASLLILIEARLPRYLLVSCIGFNFISKETQKVILQVASSCIFYYTVPPSVCLDDI